MGQRTIKGAAQQRRAHLQLGHQGGNIKVACWDRSPDPPGTPPPPPPGVPGPPQGGYPDPPGGGTWTPPGGVPGTPPGGTQTPRGGTRTPQGGYPDPPPGGYPDSDCQVSLTFLISSLCSDQCIFVLFSSFVAVTSVPFVVYFIVRILISTDQLQDVRYI